MNTLEAMTFPSSGLIPAVLSGYALSLLAPGVHNLFRRLSGWLIALLPTSLFVYFATLLRPVAAGHNVTASIVWVPTLGINLTFVADGLGLFMALIVSGIGALVILYASSYLKGHPQIGRFYTFVLIFMASMLVLVLADNIFIMFVGWELTSISSYFLIGFYHERKESQQAALQALLVTGVGGLAMLMGLVLLSLAGGSSDFSLLQPAGAALRADALYLPILLLIFLGAFTKSAQFPFHFWLPNAMAGPAPVSTYLHSATMVTAGVYLLARLNPVLGGTGVWFYTIVTIGGVTALLGAWLSWLQTDLKSLLAYSTVSALGTMVLLIGLGTKLAVETAVLFLLVHALYKAGLFMVAGTVDHETGVRDVRLLGGLRRSMPFSFAAALLAALSMAGLPPLLGFISKELMYETALELHQAPWPLVVTLTLLLTNILMVTAAAIVLLRPFFGAPTDHQPHHRPPLKMWLGPLLLGVSALALGFLAGSPLVSERLIAPAASSVAGQPVAVELALWHGWTPMLALSAVTVTGGLLFYALHRRFYPAAARLETAVARVGPEQLWERGWSGLLALAARLTNLLQNGYLRYYLLYVVVTFLVLVGFSLVTRAGLRLPQTDTLRAYELIIGVVIWVAILFVVRNPSRLAAVASLGVVGYGIAVLYILFGAPDLAMTQFAVETLTVILFVLVLYRLPRFETFSRNRTRLRDAAIALSVGVAMGALVLAANTVSAPSVVSDYYADASYVLAKGRNIVNVILIDFRGFDTMVEVTVLSVAAIGVYALLKSRPHLRRDGEEQPQRAASLPQEHPPGETVPSDEE